jgi:hypothetical protein
VDQLKDQAGGAEGLPRRILSIVDARIDQCTGNPAFLGDVVVDDNDIDALSAQAIHFGFGIRSAIQGHE